MTDDADFKSILDRLPRFSDEQKGKLLARLKQQKTVAISASPSEDDAKGDWLFTGICAALRQKGMISNASLYGLKRTRGYQKYHASRERIAKELETLLPAKDRDQSRLALAQLVGTALITWCEKKTIVYLLRDERTGKLIPFKDKQEGRKYEVVPTKIREVSAGFVLDNAAQAIEALELCFPGYVDANLFHVVLTGFERETVR